jgi:hypothetical protein
MLRAVAAFIVFVLASSPVMLLACELVGCGAAAAASEQPACHQPPATSDETGARSGARECRHTDRVAPSLAGFAQAHEPQVALFLPAFLYVVEREGHRLLPTDDDRSRVIRIPRDISLRI